MLALTIGNACQPLGILADYWECLSKKPSLPGSSTPGPRNTIVAISNGGTKGMTEYHDREHRTEDPVNEGDSAKRDSLPLVTANGHIPLPNNGYVDTPDETPMQYLVVEEKILHI